MAIDWQPNEAEQKLIDLGMEAEARDLYWVRQLRHHVGLKERILELHTLTKGKLSPPHTDEKSWAANFFLTVVCLLEGHNPPPRRTFGALIP